MASFNEYFGIGGTDYSTSLGFGGNDYSPIYGDVSNGAQDMQPSTSTGNGSGVFLDTSTQNAIFGTLTNVLNYALKRDQIKMQAGLAQPQQQAQAQIQYVQTKNNNMLVWAGLGLAALWIMNK
ncbi:hypothetical protein [Janthinobacterium sp. PSPC3-1]|uniref:hypothetical protein n=1 Tax=Janthinobacterium sp. PSPC3-1 TaxID=2804653 RepID=UPI003CF1CAB1